MTDLILISVKFFVLGFSSLTAFVFFIGIFQAKDDKVRLSLGLFVLSVLVFIAVLT